jgi:hypothetical protein
MVSKLRLIQHCAEFRHRDEVTKIRKIRKSTRGIYALLKKRKTVKGTKYDVVYIGMSRRGVRSRLRDHYARKEGLWTHFSVYSVWPNITDEEIRELEGLFRAIYRKDANANRIAVQKSFKELSRIRDNSFDWDA